MAANASFPVAYRATLIAVRSQLLSRAHEVLNDVRGVHKCVVSVESDRERGQGPRRGPRQCSPVNNVERGPMARAERERERGDRAGGARVRRGAAAAFRRLLAAPEGEITEDAAFWHAVAVVHGGEPASDAAATLSAVLADYPHSTRVAEANTLLGSVFLERDQPDEANLRFEQALATGNAEVRARARPARRGASPPSRPQP